MFVYICDGQAGSIGSNGIVGTGGKKGYTGYNQTGSSESVKKYYYLYDFDNFTTIYIN